MSFAYEGRFSFGTEVGLLEVSLDDVGFDTLFNGATFLLAKDLAVWGLVCELELFLVLNFA